jgi:hypothetical protein
VSGAVQLDWFDDAPEHPGVVVELGQPGAEVANDARVQAYIRDHLQPAAEALDKAKQAFLLATTPAPKEGFVAARARLAYELAQGGKSAEEISQLLMPTPAEIKADLMRRFGGR